MKPETKVGLMVSIAIAILMVSIFLVGNFRLGGGYTLNVVFSFVNNIKVDARVLYAGGVTVGRVRRLVQEGDMVKLVLNIDPGVKVRSDAEITIYSQGLLGEKYVEINSSPAPSEPRYLEAGATVRGEDPISGDATMVTLHRIAYALRSETGDPEMKEALIRTVKNASRVVDTLNQLLQDNSENVRASLKNFRDTSDSLQNLAKSMQSLLGNLNDLASAKNKEDLQNTISRLDRISSQVEAASGSVAALTQEIQKGQGVANELIYDKQMGQDLKDLVADLKNNPWKLMWKK